MSLEVWLAFCATETVLCFTPQSGARFALRATVSRYPASSARSR